MCGRTACSLNQKCIQRATSDYSKNKESPKWVKLYEWQNYQPNYNLSPTQVSPVLVREDVIYPNKESEDYILLPMRWGLIPSWYNGILSEFSLKTNNCRTETIFSKPSYKGPLSVGKRCVILADGFYEWKSLGKNGKQPFFIYFPQENGFDVFTQKIELENNLDEKWNGPRLLTMAGVFDIWKNSNQELIYSYSVLTLDSSKKISSIHSRMPAILDGEKSVQMWLDSKRVPMQEAIAQLKPIEDLEMHPVSTFVNYSRNNNIDCFLPLKETTPPKVQKRTALVSWLKGEPKETISKHFKSE